MTWNIDFKFKLNMLCWKVKQNLNNIIVCFFVLCFLSFFKHYLWCDMLQQLKYTLLQLTKGLSQWHRWRCFCGFTVGKNRSTQRKPFCQFDLMTTNRFLKLTVGIIPSDRSEHLPISQSDSFISYKQLPRLFKQSSVMYWLYCLKNCGQWINARDIPRSRLQNIHRRGCSTNTTQSAKPLDIAVSAVSVLI